MSTLFLLNEAIDTTDFGCFKKGIFELIAIKKRPDHVFYKHDSIYSLPVIVNGIYPNLSGQEEQEVFRFIEQMSLYDHCCYINTEKEANIFSQSNFNGFLGFINFGTIKSEKQIANDQKYKEWCFCFSDNKKELLKETSILAEDKKCHLADHHGKRELDELWKRIRNSPYIEAARSTNFGSKGKVFIREIHNNGEIEIVLNNSDKEYALLVSTTGKDIYETTAIAEILKSTYK